MNILGTLVLYEGRVHFGAPESLSESIPASDRSRYHASPQRFCVDAVAQHHDLSLTVPARCWDDNAVAVVHIWLVNEMGMDGVVVPRRCRTCRREKGLDIQIEN